MNCDINIKTNHTLKNYLFLYDIGGNNLFEKYVNNMSKSQLKSYKETDREAKFSHFFEPYWIEKGYTKEEANDIVNKRKNKAKTLSLHKMKNVYDRTTVQIGYWIKKGYTKEEAIKKVHDRQVTFSKQICIDKHGKEKGIDIWKQRQINWQNTLKSKSKEEIKRINILKKPKRLNKYFISSAEKELKNILKCESQFLLENETSYYLYDLKKGNKIIEYNGDYWHCNPKKYNEDFFNKQLNMTAKEKWKNDKDKISYAQSKSFDVLVIWEKDYKEHKEEVIKQCKDFFK